MKLPRQLFLAAALAAAPAFANPEGMTVTSGSASAVRSGPQLNITAAHNAVIDWQRFNIAAGETTSFLQPSASSIVWNRINDNAASMINGNLSANGFLVLFNRSGFYFGPNSVVNVGGALITAAPPMSPEFGGGNFWQYNGPPPSASIINYGQINAKSGGSVYLIAEKIENHGVLTAPDGTLGLYAGKEVLVSERPDGRGLSANVRLPEGSVDNHGKLIADAGTIAMHAQVVNQHGLVQANSVRERNGVIELIASEAVNLSGDSSLQANGGAAGRSDAGRITVKSAGAFSDQAGSQISVVGGAEGGRGGAVEISARQLPAIHSRVDGHAQTPGQGGSLVIDPEYIVLGNGGASTPDGSGNVSAGDPGTTLNFNVNSAFAGFAHISLQATKDITVAGNTIWDLNASTGISDPGSQLTLQAGNNILFSAGSGISAGPGWSVQLVAGASDFSSFNSTAVTPGVGSIFLGGAGGGNGDGFLQATDGTLRLFAGKDVLLGRGFVNTTGGGSIEVRAGGTINTGTKSDAYDFSETGYEPSASVSGISTIAGGNVNLTAGQDIISLLPGAGDSGDSLAATGAFGPQPGDVTLSAGRIVQGSFLVRNGTGTITAGVTLDATGTQVASVLNPDASIGSGSVPVALSLMSGQWSLWAARDIVLQEVRNPNGVFNTFRTAAEFNGVALPVEKQNLRNYFDYADDAAVHLHGGNAVQLLGSSLPRAVASMPVIYPPILDITAGAGGISVNSTTVLAPSAKGDLKLKTTDGGSLVGPLDSLVSLLMSDSRSPAFGSFISGRSDPPLHQNDPVPARLDISGNIENLLIQIPKPADITVHGNTANFSYVGQNYRATDETSIKVEGNIFNRINRTFVFPTDVPDFSVLDPANSLNPLVFQKLTYNATTGKLGWIGRMSTAERDYLLNPQVVQRDLFGGVITDTDGLPIYLPAKFTADTAAIQQLYTETQSVPIFVGRGFELGGPGKFTITAHDLDLGITDGIRSIGALNNPALGKLARKGADVSLTLGGNLDMISSRVVSFNGGRIEVTAGGSVNMGSQEQFTGSSVPKGIFTTAKADVTVTAGGDVNINGSRIAAYDGGNVSVRSLHGDVNAGSGGTGFVVVNSVTVDENGAVKKASFTIPGSGILATALPGSPTTVGDILVEAKEGSIFANSGGVIQLPFNNSSASAGNVSLTAGKDINANNSGVIGANIELQAKGNIIGLVVARQNIDIQSQQAVNVTAVAQGNVSVSAGTTVSGTIVAGGGVEASGSSISAALVSTSVSTAGEASGATVGVQATSAARSEGKVSEDSEKKVMTAAKKTDDDENDAKKKGRGPMLAKTAGRVTVILPPKNNTP